MTTRTKKARTRQFGHEPEGSESEETQEEKILEDEKAKKIVNVVTGETVEERGEINEEWRARR